MAKARMVSQQIAEDSKVGRLSDEAALAYAFTIPFLDRDGLCSGKPSWIGGRALQERPHLQHKAGVYIQEWVAQGLVIRYEGSDGPVLYFPGFRKHNANLDYRREPKSKFPPPPGYEYGEDGLLPSNPQIARTAADSFDKRNSYHIALIAHAKRLEEKLASGRDDADDLIEDALSNSTSHKDSTEFHRKVTGNSGETPSLMEDKIIEDKEKRREEKGEGQNAADAAPTPPAFSLQALKQEPLIRAYHDLYDSWPNKAQMQIILDANPLIADWVHGMRAWAAAGHSPRNVQGMLDWAFEPSRFANVQHRADKGDGPKRSYRPDEYADIILG